MRSVKQLRDGAALERQRSDGYRQQAQHHRDKAGTLPQDADPNLGLQETNAAQKLEEKAAEHDRQALKFEQEAADLEAKALQVEREQQQLQVSSQQRLDKLEQQKNALRGDV